MERRSRCRRLFCLKIDTKKEREMNKQKESLTIFYLVSQAADEQQMFYWKNKSDLEMRHCE